MRIDGRLIGLFSYDVGYEIDLVRARALAEAGTPRGLSGRRPAPPYLRYATPPLRVPLPALPVAVAEHTGTAGATATLHEFGALTVTLTLPLATEIASLPRLTATLTGAGPLEDAARGLAESLFTRVAPAVTRPGWNDMVEDYYVVQVDRFDPPATIDTFLASARGRLAATLRCEPDALAEDEIEDALRTRLSYSPDDLVVTAWNVALVVDPDWADVVDVLEYLNVQLLELRFHDALLDRHVAATYDAVSRPPRRWPLSYGPHRRAIQQLAAIRLDVATILERLHNALKLSGDLYLAKLYARTAERLGVRAWEDSVARKLDVLQQMHDLLVQRVTTARAEALEMTIIALIAVEIGLFLAGW